MYFNKKCVFYKSHFSQRGGGQWRAHGGGGKPLPRLDFLNKKLKRTKIKTKIKTEAKKPNH